MKCVILCAGYGTRLGTLTLNKSKQLLDIKGKPIIEHIIDKIDKINIIKEVIIVTNDKFYKNFKEWANSREFKKKVEVLNDGTTNNENRFGGIGDLWFAIKEKNIDEDLLVILGDNYFNFDLNKIIDFFNEKKICTLGLTKVKSKEETKEFGVVEINNNKIISFEEKPENPKSDLISTGIYLFAKRDLKKIKEYMLTEKPKNGPGFLIKDFLESSEVLAFTLNGFWYDIGSIEIYKKVNKV